MPLRCLSFVDSSDSSDWEETRGEPRKCLGTTPGGIEKEGNSVERREGWNELCSAAELTDSEYKE